MSCPTVKVKSTAPEEQGPYVIINEADFNPDVHELYDEATEAAKPTKAKKEKS